MDTLQNHKNLKKKRKRLREFREESIIAERWWRIHEQGYTQSDTEEFDRTANDNKKYVASSTERAYYRDQYKVVVTCTL